MKRYIIIFYVLTAILFLQSCEVPKLPPAPIYNNPYDPYAPNFNDELATGKWEEVKNVESYIYQRAAISNDSRCYLIGGIGLNGLTGLPKVYNSASSFKLYELDSTFFNIRSEPPMINRRTSFAFTLFNYDIYVFGGDSACSAEVYENSLSAWNSIGKLPIEKMAFGAFSINYTSNILVGGGRSNTGEISDEIWLFTPVVNTWTFFTNLPRSLSFATAQIVNDTLYVIGGFDENNSASSKIYILDLNKKDWSTYPDSLKIARGRSISFVKNGRIYVFGGEIAQGILSDAVDEIKIESKKCIVKEKINPLVFPYGSFLYNGEIFLVGGDEEKAIRIFKFLLFY